MKTASKFGTTERSWSMPTLNSGFILANFCNKKCPELLGFHSISNCNLGSYERKKHYVRTFVEQEQPLFNKGKETETIIY